MFENLLHQNRIKSRLISDIQSNSLPQSLLFTGADYSGKYTAALELVRVLNCQVPGAPWDCSCSSCRSQRLLIHPDTLFLGRSHFLPEIQAALDLLERRDAPSSRFMLIRNVRKIIRRFDNILWEGDEKKIKKAAKPLDELNQIINEFNPGHELPTNFQAYHEKILKFSRELIKIIPMTLPINQVRRINNWSHLASQGQNVKKAVIIDRADQMQEGARNALLKLLEEPPKDVYLIMLTSRKKRILPTILSRMRSYDFAVRDQEASQVIQQRIFKVQEPEKSLQDFFHNYFSDQGDQRRASRFLMDIYEGESLFPQYLFEDLDKDEIPQFFQEILEQLREWLHFYDKQEVPSISITVMEKWNRSIRESYSRMESLNLSGLLLLEDLFYRLRNQL